MRIHASLGFLGGRRFDPRGRRFDLGFPAILSFLEVLPPEAGDSIPEACASISGFPQSLIFGGFAARGRPFDPTRGLHLGLTLLRLRHGASCANAQSTPMLGPMLVSRCVQCPPPPPPTTLKQITARPRQTSDVRCIRYISTQCVDIEYT